MRTTLKAILAAILIVILLILGIAIIISTILTKGTDLTLVVQAAAGAVLVTVSVIAGIHLINTIHE